MTTMTASAAGLEGVVAAETALSQVDGQAGRLIVSGHDIEELAAGFDFADTAALLWRGLAPADSEAAGIRAELGRARRAAAERLPLLLPAADGLSPIEGLRLGLAMLADDDAIGDHLAVSGAIPVFTAALWRRQGGQEVVAPDPELGQAADFLAMLAGRAPDEAPARALETYLVTVADHGLNASTFTARVVASTRAGTVSSVVAALCALKGPLHGGAPGPVLDALDEIGDESGIDAWLDAKLAAGERLMGFGHRVYRTRDPRADVLKGVVANLRGGGNRIAFAEAVERAVLAKLAARYPDRQLDTNVEFYTALVLEAVGLPRELFTLAFAMGRVLGWTAHIFEQEQSGRIIRPSSHYVGPVPDGAKLAAVAG
ncbi:MAG: citrate synthase/methylcitrate synthase [Alphaproteobacteria bacterium]|jgi:citrate synthase|nr:citrate synthase/methylcitrate synthase [Alphaproteobacteria bacterium]MDP6565382.1 citrate synthase/methylcitrate synthase [Alphaproteobacteria bacterium]MDP6813530.1 citrate synthase/methylcitrate synthase [Alphaproteobacteria bacterium]